MKKIMILSGAGLSAESGISTFRDSDGLWENHDVMKVCSTLSKLRPSHPSLYISHYFITQ